MKDDIFSFTSKEFFDFLNQKKSDINIIANNRRNNLLILKKFCDKYNNSSFYSNYVCNEHKLKTFLKEKDGKKMIAKLLEETVGEELLDNKSDLNRKLKPIINMGYIKKPTDYYKVARCIEIIMDRQKQSIQILDATHYFNFMFEDIFEKCDMQYNISLKVIDIINDILKTVKMKKIIDINEDVHILSSYFNNNSTCVKINDDGTKEEINAKFGDLLTCYINDYNNEILLRKRKNIIKSKSDSYYKKLKKKYKNGLSEDDFPSYDDIDANEVYNALLAKTLEKGKKNSDILDLHTVLSIMYMRYCKFKDESNNISISKQGR